MALGTVVTRKKSGALAPPSMFGTTATGKGMFSTEAEPCCVDDSTQITVVTQLPDSSSDTYSNEVANIMGAGLSCSISYKRKLRCKCKPRRKYGFGPVRLSAESEGTTLVFRMYYRRWVCPAKGECPDKCSGGFNFPTIVESENSKVAGGDCPPEMCDLGNDQHPALLYDCKVTTQTDAEFVLDVQNQGFDEGTFPQQDLVDLVAEGLQDTIKKRLDGLNLVNFDCGLLGGDPPPEIY